MNIYQRLVDNFDCFLRENNKRENDFYDKLPKIERLLKEIPKGHDDWLDKLPEKPVIKPGSAGFLKKYKINGNGLIFKKKYFRKKNLSKTIIKGVSYYYNSKNKLSIDEQINFGDYLVNCLCELLNKPYYAVNFNYGRGD